MENLEILIQQLEEYDLNIVKYNVEEIRRELEVDWFDTITIARNRETLEVIYDKKSKKLQLYTTFSNLELTDELVEKIIKVKNTVNNYNNGAIVNVKRMEDIIHDEVKMVEKEFPDMEWCDLHEEVWNLIEEYGDKYFKMNKTDRFDYLVDNIILNGK